MTTKKEILENSRSVGLADSSEKIEFSEKPVEPGPWGTYALEFLTLSRDWGRNMTG